MPQKPVSPRALQVKPENRLAPAGVEATSRQNTTPPKQGARKTPPNPTQPPSAAADFENVFSCQRNTLQTRPPNERFGPNSEVQCVHYDWPPLGLQCPLQPVNPSTDARAKRHSTCLLLNAGLGTDSGPALEFGFLSDQDPGAMNSLIQSEPTASLSRRGKKKGPPNRAALREHNNNNYLRRRIMKAPTKPKPARATTEGSGMLVTAKEARPGFALLRA